MKVQVFVVKCCASGLKIGHRIGWFCQLKQIKEHAVHFQFLFDQKLGQNAKKWAEKPGKVIKN